MAVPEDIQKKADRRIFLWHKNNGVGLTDAEIAEYRKLLRAVSAYIKKTWPETWNSYRYLSTRRRIKFKKAPPPPKPKAKKAVKAPKPIGKKAMNGYLKLYNEIMKAKAAV